MQRTLSIIKPDAVQAGFSGAIIEAIEKELKIIAIKKCWLSQNQARAFYAVHANKPFYDELVTFMTSGPVIAMVLEGEDAIVRYRNLMGATNPEKAEEGTLRKRFASSMQNNAVHGSDAVETAQVEVNFFFSQSELIALS